MSSRRLLLLLPAVALAAAPTALAQRLLPGPVLHEPIPADPREDVAMGLALDGDLPAALHTPFGLVAAPDPTRPVGEGESPYSPQARSEDASFRPDRDTRRPDVLPYDDPFSPSTAPFKRLNAYDTVRADYTLEVRDPSTSTLPVSAIPSPAPSEELFYADMVVELAPGRKVRVPSVGPGARVLHARAGIGAQDVPLRMYRDGADNWFVEADSVSKVRLVMELAITRATFGGDFGSPTWAELPLVPPLPAAIDRAAAEVAARIGVSRAKPPRDVVGKLVSYYRGFAESEEPPTSSRDIYLDLALSRKGVCRHRAFAFMITALHLRLPTRMITNEAHAWVEVYDGRLWRRLDLGGAGRMLHDAESRNVPYEAPPDSFAWPQGSTRGEDMAERSRHGASTPPRPSPRSPAPSPSGSAAPSTPSSPSGFAGPLGSAEPAAPGPPSMGGAGGLLGGASPSRGGPAAPPDERPPSTVTMSLQGTDARRGAPFRVRGDVSADGEPCASVTVDIALRGAAGELPIGQLATDARGVYDGALVLPATVPLGDYEIHARTLGDARCGSSIGAARGAR